MTTILHYPALPVNSFSELIKLQEGLLMRLAAVSLQQLELVNASNITTLLQLLGQKYQLLDEYEEIRQALRLHGEVDPDERQWKNDAERADAKNSIEHSRRLLDDIMRNDKQSMDEIELQREELKNEICRFDRISHTQLGYAKTGGGKTFVRHFDVKEK
ncbi:MAG: hypothetical protein LBJ00_09455 [Planctomycetaceae bacterium]|jgi:hypothetical protein|nr:hypothetical protein [Planctomycetaceae bacterium]